MSVILTDPPMSQCCEAPLITGSLCSSCYEPSGPVEELPDSFRFIRRLCGLILAAIFAAMYLAPWLSEGK